MLKQVWFERSTSAEFSIRVYMCVMYVMMSAATFTVRHQSVISVCNGPLFWARQTEVFSFDATSEVIYSYALEWYIPQQLLTNAYTSPYWVLLMYPYMTHMSD